MILEIADIAAKTKLAERIFQRYGTEKGTKILCKCNIRNLMQIYGTEK